MSFSDKKKTFLFPIFLEIRAHIQMEATSANVRSF